jgi:hypothetical protein
MDLKRPGHHRPRRAGHDDASGGIADVFTRSKNERERA